MAFVTRLFVGNLSESTEEKDLHAAFSVFGEITNLDLKTKSNTSNDNKKFAFVTISAANNNVESCIKHFTNKEFKGHKVYVTRARESFLERLQKERDQTQKKDIERTDTDILPKHNPVIRLSDKLNPRKRKLEHPPVNINPKNKQNNNFPTSDTVTKNRSHLSEADKKKNDSEQKRLDSMKKKRQEFKEKKMIIKTGLTEIDKVQNKKIVFSDNEDDKYPNPKWDKTEQLNINKNSLFDDEDGDENNDELNFDIKKQFEGKKGQKVLDLQSRYKSDKRFTLDERFIDEDDDDDGIRNSEGQTAENVKTDINPEDEKAKQLSILQDILGVTIKNKISDPDSKKAKPKLAMLRYNPLQPDHAKFLAPIEELKQEPTKKSKKKAKEKIEVEKEEPPKEEAPKIEVSKETFYKVSETLKEAIAQPNTFSLRSLFGKNEDEPQEQQSDYVPLETPKKKVKNPLDPTERNPFVYDSSESENEEVEKQEKTEVASTNEPKAVWRENLFFSIADQRLKEGLEYFMKPTQGEVHKDRRELKYLMKKRLYNNDRKNQMFQKKIGGRKKSMKNHTKPYKNKG